jgi:septum formation protein
VVLENRVLGKPRTEEAAKDMLRSLSGRHHTVMTAFCLWKDGMADTHVEKTHVHFRELSDEEIAAYVATGSPMDKAGAYGIQGGAALFAQRMVGDYYNVMGLPVCRLYEILSQLAPDWMEENQ